jgi:hypothetical protein
LKGEVNEEQFNRLANGQHPETGEQLVRHWESFEYQNENGDTVIAPAGTLPLARRRAFR